MNRETVVVTGASAGVGRAVVREFARRGARVALLARGDAGLQGAYDDVVRSGGSALMLPTDVSDPAQIENAAERIEQKWGPIDIWINNAMVSVFSPIDRMTTEDFKRVTDVTYLGYVYGTLAALKRMKPRNRGTILQVGSALAYRSIPLQSAYCGAKHAIEGFTQSLRCELLHDNSDVYVTMVQLPAVNTPQFSWSKSNLPRSPQPVPPIYEPEVIARAIYWAAHHRRREWVVGGNVALILALNKFFPGLGDRYLAAIGYGSQQTDQPADPDRPNNLWMPVNEDRGARGQFSARSRNSSFYFQLSARRRALLSSLVALVGGAIVLRSLASKHSGPRLKQAAF